jgi:hypothetical protein
VLNLQKVLYAENFIRWQHMLENILKLIFVGNSAVQCLRLERVKAYRLYNFSIAQEKVVK